MEVMCEVCQSQLPKYKCPSCRIVYCSLGCWKSHKESSCSHQRKENDEPNISIEKKEEYYFQTEDTVPIEKLQLLRESEGLRDILRNPHVRDMLSAIDSSPNPAAAMKAAMLEPIFVEFADKCLELVEPSSQKT
ncbi:zinc finger HIT domain-containing protein 3 [Anabrus simplex]|uniref:zinc finger HIT domain-containing protein 3 n=1 Tax=Anabrus simplex TaxID=316456 RepID=UPI0034DD3EA7